MEDYSLMYLIAGIISLIIMYYIIKDAVISANKDLLKETKIQNDLKILDLKKTGTTDEEISEIVNKYYQKKKWFGK